METRRWTRAVLDSRRLTWLARLPPELEIELDGRRFAVTHAYPRGDERYLGPTDEELRRTARAFPRAAVIVLGHTHRQGIWHQGATTIVMPGSLGQSGRGGQASFVVCESQGITLHNEPYNVSRAVRGVKSTPWSWATKIECVRALEHGSTRPFERVAVHE